MVRQQQPQRLRQQQQQQQQQQRWKYHPHARITCSCACLLSPRCQSFHDQGLASLHGNVILRQSRHHCEAERHHNECGGSSRLECHSKSLEMVGLSCWSHLSTPLRVAACCCLAAVAPPSWKLLGPDQTFPLKRGAS